MKKRNLIGLPVLIFIVAINLASASIRNVSFRSFSFQNFVNSFSATLGNNPPLTLALIGLFFLIFAFLDRLVFSKLFRGSRVISVVVSLLFSISAVWGISNLELDYLFLKWGLQDKFLLSFGIIVTLLGTFFASRTKDAYTGKKRFSFKKFLFILGLVLIPVGIFIGENLVYRKNVLIVIGIVLILISIIVIPILNILKRKGKQFASEFPSNVGSAAKKGIKRGWKWMKKRRMERQKKNEKIPLNPAIRNEGTKRRGNVRELIGLAKIFKKEVEKTNNPSFYGGGVNFVGWLKKFGKYGGNTKEICNYFGISDRDFGRIFRKHGMPDSLRNKK